ncbi:MAG: phosphotransferase, partial [Pseudomonadota bacterium]
GAAEAVGDALGRVHAASTAADFDRSPFNNRDDFHALRIEPYLSFTATRHPALAQTLNALGTMLYKSSAVLIHGDVSPKNILFRGSTPLILDAECATMGDPCFDPAFCLNHLVLKAFHLPASRHYLLTSIEAFWRAYAAHVTWEEATDLEARVCRLLPALMLARVDGKSPVEYLSKPDRARVRSFATKGAPSPSVKAFLRAVVTALEATEHTPQ